jgi:hypothetical protein
MEDAVMAIARYEPWTVVSQLQNEINRVFGNLNDGESSSAVNAVWAVSIGASLCPIPSTPKR